jgi:hypothetical protein
VRVSQERAAEPVPTLAPLGVPDYRRIWSASMVSNLGTFLQLTAAPWLMNELTGSALMVALVTTALTLPRLVLTLPAGALADVVGPDELREDLVARRDGGDLGERIPPDRRRARAKSLVDRPIELGAEPDQQGRARDNEHHQRHAREDERQPSSDRQVHRAPRGGDSRRLAPSRSTADRTAGRPSP